MSVFSLGFALAILVVVVLMAIELMRGVRSTEFLEEIPPEDSPSSPFVSVVVPARNEEKNLEAALRSMLAQTYSPFEIIVIDDRSTDQTGAILDRLAREFPLLRVFHLQTLPNGWLGKNHALFLGASKARGTLLLFTDADVMMEPSTLSRSIRYLMTERLDHLAVSPRLAMDGLVLNIFAIGFNFFFSLYARPWKARDRRSPAHIGIGAFNLMRREVYESIGTHQQIAMRPDDDMKLGKLVKKMGFSQGFLMGNRLISVEWYSSVKNLIQGMMKNSFAGVNYRVSLVIAATLGQLVIFVWPFIAVLLARGPSRWVYLAIILLLLSLAGGGAYLCRNVVGLSVGLPLASVVLLYIMWNSMIQIYWHQGIFWRDTHYPLHLLKANKI
ncbi:MAG: glycosyltransferase family 2 protein [Terriglobia bacterium]